jgi:hypothetical protein
MVSAATGITTKADLGEMSAAALSALFAVGAAQAHAGVKAVN